MTSINMKYAEWIVYFLNEISTNFRNSDIKCNLKYENATDWDNYNILLINNFFNDIKAFAKENKISSHRQTKQDFFCDYHITQYIIKYQDTIFRIGNTSTYLYNKGEKKKFNICTFCEKLNDNSVCDIDLNQLLIKKEKTLIK